MAVFMNMFTTIKDQTEAIAGQFSNIVNMVMPAFQAVFIVYCMFVIWSYWENESSIQGTFIDLMKRIISWGLILGLGMNIDSYMNTVMPVVNDLGTDLAAGYSGNTADASMLDSVIDKINAIGTATLEAAYAANDQQMDVASTGEVATTPAEDEGFFGSFGSAVGDAVSSVGDAITGGMFEAAFGTIGNIIIAILKVGILWAFAAPFIAVAMAYMLVTQVMLSLLAGIGPLFFGFALFPATRTYFTNWVGQVLNYGFYFLFVIVVINLGVEVVDAQLDNIGSAMKEIAAAAGVGASAGAVTGVGGVAGGVVGGAIGAATNPMDAGISLISLLQLAATFLVFVVVIFQIPSLTSQLFGGLSAGGFGQVARAAAAAKTGGLAAAAGASKAGKAVVAKVRGNSVAENKGK